MKPEIQKKIQEGGILARVVLEVLGAPREHVEEALRAVVSKVKEAEGTEVLKEDFHEAEKKGEFFSTFVELEAVFDDIENLIDLCFAFLPSSVEIIEPEHFRMQSFEISDLMNDILARIHGMDMVLKNTNAENTLLKKNAVTILKNLVMLSLREKPKTLAELAGDSGTKQNELEPFIKMFVAEGGIKKEGELYILEDGA